MSAPAAGLPSALVVPVPGAAVVRPTGRGELPPHVTVIYPFVGSRRVDDALVASLADVLGAFPPFAFALTTVRRFPEVLYLAAEPGEPFAALTAACVRRWPEHPPYAGAFADHVAHVTLAEGPEPAGLAERAAARLPIAAQAGEVWLMTQGRTRGWRRRASIALRGPGG